MTDIPGTRAAVRRARVEREILDAAWGVMTRDGVAALSVREVARVVGMRQQSLTYYFPTKQALLDALFADGFLDLRRRFDRLSPASDPIEGVIDVATAFVEHMTARPAAYHLMFQGTVPGFRPSDASHAVALTVLQELLDRLGEAGISEPEDVALVRSLMSGIAAEQIANDPRGRLFVGQTERGMRALLASISSVRSGTSPAATRATAQAAALPLAAGRRSGGRPSEGPECNRNRPGSV